MSPKYRGKVLAGEVAEAAEEIIRETCKELDIEVIDMAVGVDYVADKGKEKTLKIGYVRFMLNSFWKRGRHLKTER
ncbi:MAG: transposase [Methanophagales archaeon]|nr:transposase [Methanophagales archaeon]MCW3141741.1 transposase [Methanophagales archaeon]